MYKAETLKEAIFGATPLVAWEQDYNPANQQLDEAITVPTSGRYFQEAHAMLTLSNVFSIAPRFEDYVYPAYAAGTGYVIGQKVSDSGINYVALTGTLASPNTGNTPATSTDDWAVWTIGNARTEWLTRKTQGYVLSVFDDILDAKKWSRNAKSIIEERPLFDGSQSTVDLTEAKNKTVGFEIKVSRHTSVVAKLNQISLHFDQEQAVTVSLYHSSSNTPKQTKVVTGGVSSVLVDLGWELPYLSGYDAGGTYRIEFEHTVPSVNKAKDWTPNPVYRQGYNYNSWKLWSPYLDLHPYEVSTADKNDPSKRVYAYTDNFGMNLLVSVYCDYTTLFTRQASVFQNAIVKGVGLKFLREIALNPNSRINQRESTSNISKEELLYEIDGNPQGRKTGLGKEYELALDAVIIDTQGLDQICLPCSRRKLKMKTT